MVGEQVLYAADASCIVVQVPQLPFDSLWNVVACLSQLMVMRHVPKLLDSCCVVVPVVALLYSKTAKGLVM